MADWEEPLDSQTDPDAPITSQLGKRWDNNVVAMAEGAAGAPRVRIGALQRLSAGDAIRVRSDAEVSGISVTGISFSFLQQGTIRVLFYHRHVTGGGVARVIRTRGVVDTVIAEFANSTSYVMRTVDCPVSPGDNVSVVNLSYDTVNPAYLQYCRIQTGGEDVFPGARVGAVLEGNTYA